MAGVQASRWSNVVLMIPPRWRGVVEARRRGGFAGNFAWMLVGTGLPLVAAAFMIPALYRGLGIDRFGVLSLAWVVVGYFSLFDLGLGRALTQLVARKLDTPLDHEIPADVGTGLRLMLWLGLFGGTLAALASPWIVHHGINIPPATQGETLAAFYWLAFSIPVVILTTGLRGILEAHQRFAVVNIVRAPLGVLTYLGPLVVLQFSNALPSVVASLVVARFVSLLIYALLCARLYPGLLRGKGRSGAATRDLLAFGGWMTVSNIVGPLLLYLGRLVLAATISAAAVAWFSTPYDMVINALIVPGAIASVAFPMFTQRFAREPEGVAATYRRMQWFNFVCMLPVALLTIAFAHPVIAWWLSPDFADHSYRAAQLIGFGVLINSFGHISQALVQAAGRPDLTAKLHLFELAAYLPYLWFLVERYGVDGAALAWVIRVVISTFVLWLQVRFCLHAAARSHQEFRPT